MFSFFKKKKVVNKVKGDRFSANAITTRTKVIRDRAANFANSSKSISETTTKVQLIFPFFKELGWDVSDPETGGLEVIAGGHNKADLMLIKNNVAKVVVEAKAVGHNLSDSKYVQQLSGYFENCYASIGVLTDGIIYHFYSYCEGSEDHMDSVPFAVVDIRRLQLSGKNRFLIYLCKPKLDIDKLIMFGRTRFTMNKLKAQKKLDNSDRSIRDAFLSSFPECTPQEIDELIEFANYHYKK